MKTFHIHIKGQVQGLGFRPFIYRVAKECGLKGWVNNTTDGVHIELNTDSFFLKKFIEKVQLQAPPQAIIEKLITQEIPHKTFDRFEIVLSKENEMRTVRISPDFAICESCTQDTFSPKNKRYQYGFTTCTQCGPRYSIIKKLPYDRPNTSMEKFEMCNACTGEYHNVSDRRFYSQTNSCPDCRIKLSIFKNGMQLDLPDEDIPEYISTQIKNGKIGAIKGIGGYLLVCDATQPGVIRELRKRKSRPDKPFAIMARDKVQIEKFALCSDIEWKLLSDYPAPILLLDLNKSPNCLALDQIAPNLDKIGVMLPYAPLFRLIMEHLDHPIIATSGNLSGSPIIYQNETALKELTQFADYIVLNNREIMAPQDDSVLSYAPKSGVSVFLRRSRGYAPSYFGPTPLMEENQLALGAEMKGSFAIYKNNQIYLSQYLGDLGSYDSQQSFQQSLKHLSSLIDLTHDKILADLHPLYFSHRYADEIPSQKKFFIQHHKAHFAGILLEKGIIDLNETILGVIWDGTGYGEDNKTWGGEFFTYYRYHFSREYHLKYFKNLLGDKMSLEPRLSALSMFYHFPDAHEILRQKFSPDEWDLYQKMLKKSENHLSSSMGRLFDAISSILGIIDKATFEGQSGMYLEVLARKAKLSDFNPYKLDLENRSIDFNPVLSQILEDIINSVDKAKISLRFHDTLVDLIDQVAKQLKVKKLAFSGGVFQNQLLIERIYEQLNNTYTLYFHCLVSPNDENIALGQLAFHYIEEKRKSLKIPEEELKIGEIFDQA